MKNNADNNIKHLSSLQSLYIMQSSPIKKKKSKGGGTSSLLQLAEDLGLQAVADQLRSDREEQEVTND